MAAWSQRIQDRYRVDRELAHREHVSTWLVTDLKTVMPCVLKVLRDAEASPGEVRRFEARARVLAGLDHPALPRLVEYFVEGEGGGREHVLITRYHPGESLDLLLTKGRLYSEEQALALLRRLASVLTYLHAFDPPLVHRGLKPSNVIIGPDGRPCLTDLNFVVEGDEPEAPGASPAQGTDGGLLRASDVTTGLTIAAPEAALGRPVPASDICALGLVVFYAMTGHDPAAVAREGGRQRVREATRAGEGFAAVLARMIDPSLEKRYPDARALEADLARLGTSRSPAATTQAQAAALQPRPAGPSPAPAGPAPGSRPVRPQRLVVAAVVLAAVLAIVWANWLRRDEPSGGTLVPPPVSGGSTAPTPPAGPAEASAPVAAPAPPSAPPSAPASAETAGPPAESAAPVPASGAEAAAPAGAPTAPAEPAGQPAAPLAATAAASPEASPVVAEGRLLFDGQPISAVTSLPPTFRFRDEAKATVEKPAVEYADGAFRVRGLPPGRMGVGARINLDPATPNLFPGDLDAWTTFVVGDGPPAVVEVNLRKVIRLTQPVDNGAAIRGWDTPCGGGSVHPGQLLFAWEALDPAATYQVAIERLACGRGYAPAGRAFTTSTTEAWVKVELEPSAEGECYSFRLTARKGGRPIGILTTHGRGGVGWDHRFVVK